MKDNLTTVKCKMNLLNSFCDLKRNKNMFNRKFDPKQNFYDLHLDTLQGGHARQGNTRQYCPSQLSLKVSFLASFLIKFKGLLSLFFSVPE